MRAGRRRPPRAVARVRRALWWGSHHPLPVVRGSARVASGFVRVLDATASRSRVFFVSRRATGSGRWARLGVWWRRRLVGIGDAFELRTNPVDRPRDALEFFLDAL